MPRPRPARLGASAQDAGLHSALAVPLTHSGQTRPDPVSTLKPAPAYQRARYRRSPRPRAPRRSGSRWASRRRRCGSARRRRGRRSWPGPRARGTWATPACASRPSTASPAAAAAAGRWGRTCCACRCRLSPVRLALPPVHRQPVSHSAEVGDRCKDVRESTREGQREHKRGSERAQEGVYEHRRDRCNDPTSSRIGYPMWPSGKQPSHSRSPNRGSLITPTRSQHTTLITPTRSQHTNEARSGRFPSHIG
jgi:hypothetical protein